MDPKCLRKRGPIAFCLFIICQSFEQLWTFTWRNQIRSKYLKNGKFTSNSKNNKLENLRSHVISSRWHEPWILLIPKHKINKSSNKEFLIVNHSTIHLFAPILCHSLSKLTVPYKKKLIRKAMKWKIKSRYLFPIFYPIDDLLLDRKAKLKGKHGISMGNLPEVCITTMFDQAASRNKIGRSEFMTSRKQIMKNS